MPQCDTSHFPQLIRDRYKNIKKTILGDYIILDCYTDEKCSTAYYVKVIFHGSVAIYYGDMGTYVFGKNIQKATRFFSWKVNLPYWYEKLEASFRPAIIEEIDLDELEAALLQELKDNGIDLELTDEDGKKEWDDLLFAMDCAFYGAHEHYIAAYNHVYNKLKNDWPLTDFDETLSHVVDQCRYPDETYVYCCELLHYLAAEILTDEDREV